MQRTRVLFLSVSLGVLMLFSGVLLASRSSQDVLFRALGNLAEVVHLIETEYVDELNQEALALSLDAGLVESLNQSAAVLPIDRIGDYLELVESPPPYGLGLSSRLGSAAVQYVFPGSPAEAAGLTTWEVIELVEGVNSRGRPLWQIRLDLMGRERAGEAVRLTVFDRDVDERRDVVLEPAEWAVRAAVAEERDEVTIVEIEAVSGDVVDSVSELVPSEGPVILDLRELRWGIEAETITLADSFVRAGRLGQWKGRRAGSRTYTATEGTLTFQQWTEIESVPGDLDYGSIRILDASDDSVLATMEDRTIDGNTSGWEGYSMALPAEAFTAAAGTIKVEWQFEADDIDSFAGWYIDDVTVTTPGS